MIRVPFRVFRNSYSPLTYSLKSPWSRMNFMVQVITIGDGLRDFLGASFSGRFSVSVDSVSMSLVLRCAKKLRVNTVLVGSLLAADFGADVIDFLSVREVSLEICLLRLFRSWKTSSWAADSMRFWSLLHIFLPAPSPSERPSVHSMLVCICQSQS
jgi:hypothetical protein